MAIFSRLAFIFLVLLSFSPLSFSQSLETSVGRYVTVANQPLPEQRDLLSQTFQIHFPQNVRTIGQALHYLLRWSGYALSSTKTDSSVVQNLFKKPLPAVDRTLGPMTLRDGLLTLVGEPFGLLVDPVHRLIGFRLKPAYRPIYSIAPTRSF